MSDVHKIMAKLSPIISRLGMIESAIESSGGPRFKTTRNPDGIVQMLDYASSSADELVKTRYDELMRCEHQVSVACLSDIGHQIKVAEPAAEISKKSRFYRGSKVGSIAPDAPPAEAPAAPMVDGQNALAVSAEAEPQEAPKTKTIKIVYRGKVTYKEVPI